MVDKQLSTVTDQIVTGCDFAAACGMLRFVNSTAIVAVVVLAVGLYVRCRSHGE